YRHTALSGHRRALAHSLRPCQSRSGPPRRQPSLLRQRPRLLLLLLCQRALSALFQPALPARLQQTPLRRLLAASPDLALSLEPLSARPGRRGVEDAPPL